MSKGEQTRERILARSAQLFNRQGYFGSSLADIMRETGLEKGGIYNHFSSKEQLASQVKTNDLGWMFNPQFYGQLYDELTLK